MKSLAISILNRNNIQDTIDCISSILQSSFQDFDIFLLDNGSLNKEGEKLKKLFQKKENIITTISKNNTGFTGGNNINLDSIKKKQYQYILLLNNDTIIPSDFLETFLLQIKESGKEGIFGPVIKEFSNPTLIQSSGNLLSLRTGGGRREKQIKTNIKTIDYVSGCCFLITKKCFEDVGDLDNKFFAYREESDYCFRAKKRGYKTYVINGPEIFHKEETAKKKISKYYTYLMFRNRILFEKKHANKGQYFISYLFLIAYICCIFPITFGIKQYKYALLGIKDALNNKFGEPNFF